MYFLTFTIEFLKLVYILTNEAIMHSSLRIRTCRKLLKLQRVALFEQVSHQKTE